MAGSNIEEKVRLEAGLTISSWTGNTVIAESRSRHFSVTWFRFPNGEIGSYRFQKEDRLERIAEIIAAGGTIIPDPFRKGARPGGEYPTSPTDRREAGLGS